MPSFDEILDALAQQGGGFQRQDLSDIGQGTVVPDAEGYKNLAKGSASATVGLGGDLETLLNLVNQMKQGYVDPESASITDIPNTRDVGEFFGADTESEGFGVGEFFSLDPLSKLGKIGSLASLLVARLGKPTKRGSRFFSDDPLKEELWGGAIEEALWKRNASFDPRFDDRVGQQERLGNLETIFDVPRREIPEKSIFDMEGEPAVLTMSDRQIEQGNMLGTKGTFFDEPIETTGGQFFPFKPESIDRGHAWMSNKTPMEDIQAKAGALKAKTGKDPLLLPHTMTPSGGDFSKLNGELMIKYASKNMSPEVKIEFDDLMTSYKTVGSMKDGKRVNAGRQIKGWKGVDDPASIEAWNNAPDVFRKEVKKKIFDKFKDKGGLSLGESRLALADSQQLWTPDGQLNSIIRLNPERGLTPSGYSTYDTAGYGSPIGKFKEPVESFDLIPDQLYTSQGRPLDMANPSRTDRRLLELQAYPAEITDKALRRVEDRMKGNPVKR